MTAGASDGPRPAATVVVLRERAAGGPETFLLKRHGQSAFMPSFHVFPGGCVEAQDIAFARTLPAQVQAQALDRLDGLDDAERATAYALAALRETAEESGLLLVRTADGHRPAPDVAAKLAEVLRNELHFAAHLAAYDLHPDLDALHPFAWWITPAVEPRRYDTRFFLAEVPPAQEATHDAVETTEGRWMTPADALARCRAGTIRLAPPTLATLEQLAEVDTVADAVARTPRPVWPICPRLVKTDDGTPILALPGDPCYPGDGPPALPQRTRFRVLDGRRFA
jgi:8-oxo-dGTP pyrophosphatase MutT (NUDIX family)